MCSNNTTAFHRSVMRLRAGITLLLLLHSSFHVSATKRQIGVGELVIVVLSQQDNFSSQLAQELQDGVLNQTSQQEKPVVHFLHIDFEDEPGAWTVVPILPRLLARHGHNASWFFICEPRTRIQLAQLTGLLEEHDPHTPTWLGHSLYDREPTIIHHFALLDQHKFTYPSFVAGFAINISLLKKLVSRLNNGDWPQPDFSIDVSHELSMFVWDDGGGVALKNSKLFCLKPAKDCASYPVPFTPCGYPVEVESIFFAVKTCSKFHNSRLPVVMQTWAPHTYHFFLFSDAEDPSFPNLLDLGVPNTEQGHCRKTMTIVRHVAAQFIQNPRLSWLVLADDDTIFSVGRLQELLSCYSSWQDDEPPLIALGERYGYRAREMHGYSYITGGGGTVLSRQAVLTLAAPGACDCPAPTAPDDMFMGLCFANLNIPIIHSPFFHQARPVDYAPEYLSSQHPVSFHKHWMIDPIKVYKTWFEEADNKISPIKQNFQSHIEL